MKPPRSSSPRRVSQLSGLKIPLWRRFFYALIIFFLFLAAIEIVLRIPGLTPQPFKQRRIEPGIPFMGVKKDGHESFIYKQKSSFCSVYDPRGDTRGYFGPEGKITYRINEHGFRGPDVVIKKPAGVFRVVCLGDSFTFGEGVREEDTYPVQLEKILSHSPAFSDRLVQVLNTGIMAQATTDELEWFLMGASQFQPDVVVLGFFLNDATPYMETIQQHTAMTEEPPLSFLSKHVRICELVERIWRTRRLQARFFEQTRRSFDSPGWQKCQDAFRAFQEESRKARFRFVVCIFPIFWGLDGDYPFADLHEKIAAACRNAGCEFVDMLEVFRGRPDPSLWVHPTDQHPNEIAQRLIAEKLGKVLTEARQ